MHKHIHTYWGVAELSSGGLVSRAGAGVSGGGGSSRGGRERGPPAKDEARATVVVVDGGGGGGLGLGVGVRVGVVLVSEGGLRDVDPLLLPLPDWAGEHCGGCAVPG